MVCANRLSIRSLFFLLEKIIENKIVTRIKESTVLPNIKIKTKILVPPFKNQDQTNKNVLFDKMYGKEKKQDKKKLDNEVDC